MDNSNDWLYNDKKDRGDKVTMSNAEVLTTIQGLKYNGFGQSVLFTQIRFSVLEALFKLNMKFSRYPIVINEKLDIYWFPSMSPSSPDYVWFAVHHIESYKSIGKKQTQVLLSDNSIVVIDSSVYSFEKEIQRTYTLKYKMEGRTCKPVMGVLEVKQYYQIKRVVNG